MALRKPFGDEDFVPGKAVSEAYETDDTCTECGSPIMGYDVTLPVVGVLRRLCTCPCLEQVADRDSDAKRLELAAIDRENDRLNRQRIFDNLEIGTVHPKYILENLIGHSGNYRAAIAVKTFLDKATAAQSTKGLPGFALYGPCSVGKSFLAGGLVHALMAAKIGALMVDPIRLQEALQETYDDSPKVKETDFLRALRNVPLLVLDDIGSEQIRNSGGYAKEWFHSKLFTLLNERMKNQLPVIITTNYTPSELAKRYAPNENGLKILERFIEIFDGTTSNWVHVTDTHSRRTGAPIPGR